jgi:hypothetical protein
MGKKTELRVSLSGEHVDTLQRFCNEHGGLSWAAAVRMLIVFTKVPSKVESERSGSSGEGFIQ